MNEPQYRDMDCPNCGRHRVEVNGVCEKCLWDVDNGNYASITRPTEYDTRGKIYEVDENDILGGGGPMTSLRCVGHRCVGYPVVVCLGHVRGVG